MIVKGITKIGRDFLAGIGEEEEKPVESGPSFAPIESGLRTGESGGESEKLCRGGRGEFIF